MGSLIAANPASQHEYLEYWVEACPDSARPASMRLRARVARNMRRLRAERGQTQEEVAQRAGLNRNYVGMIEREENAPTVDILERLADVLQVDAVALLDP